MTELRVVFAGTPEFAAASLRALLAAGITPSLVLTQPDRPAGRGRKLKPSPVKSLAEQHDIRVWQPVSLKSADAVDALRAERPDFLIVAAYGLILPQAILDVSKIAAVNVHASLLPRWRGAAPIQAAILAGDAQTGVDLMQMEAGLDTGPVYARRTIEIGANETGGELHDRLAVLGGELLAAEIHKIADGRLQPVPQNDALMTYAPRISKSDAKLDWTQSAIQIDRAVRAYHPWPVCYTEFTGAQLRVHRARIAPAEYSDLAAGELRETADQNVFVGCGEGALALLEVQLPGKRKISARDFANQCDLNGRRVGES